MSRYDRNRKHPAIPQPESNIASMHATLVPMKEAVDMLQGATGTAYDCAVTWGDLLQLGLITKEQIPHDVGAYRLRG